MIADCGALLAAKDILVADRSLNWSVDLPIQDWDGIEISGSPKRVTAVVRHGEFRPGKIPSGIGKLDMLTVLDLSDNKISGSIPVEIYDLVNLEVLNLSGNLLGGEIAPELSNSVGAQGTALRGE